jgi:hypothetical protein
MEDTKKILNDKAISPENRVDAFCKVCWTLESQAQRELFTILAKSFTELSDSDKVLIIPKLIKKSYCYNPLVLLAYDLFKSLPKWRYDEMELDLIWWSHDDLYTNITNEEYKWRKAHNQKCSKSDNFCIRPSVIDDFLCFEKSVEMVCKTNSKLLFFQG